MGLSRKNTIIFAITLTAAFLSFRPASALKLPDLYMDVDHLPVFAGEIAEVRINSVPTDTEINTASSTFEWYVNGVYQSSASGAGKSALRINTDKKIKDVQVLNILVRANFGPQYEVVERNYVLVVMPLIAASPELLNEQLSKLRVDFNLLAFSDTPSPGETVKLTVDQLGFDTDTAYIEWFINGKNVLSGTGRFEYSFTVGDIGQGYNAKAIVTLPDGSKNEKEKIIKVALLSLYWWADTYVPPWYKGKAMPVPNSKVTFFAIPKISKTGNPPLIYNWKINDSLAASQNSGLGKSTFEYSSALGLSDNISVVIKNVLGSINKEVPIRFNMTEPALAIYELKPLEGVDYSRKLSSLELTGGSIVDFAAEPFFIPLNKNTRITITTKAIITFNAILEFSFAAMQTPLGFIVDYSVLFFSM